MVPKTVYGLAAIGALGLLALAAILIEGTVRGNQCVDLYYIKNSFDKCVTNDTHPCIVSPTDVDRYIRALHKYEDLYCDERLK